MTIARRQLAFRLLSPGLIFLAACGTSSAAAAPVPEAPGPTAAKEASKDSAVAWGASYGDACTKAKADGKPMLLAFHTGWCPFCTKMEKTTWKDADLGKLTNSFVAAKVNADVEKVPVSRYRLTGYPTVIVAEPGGEQVLRLEGYKDAATVSAFLKAYLAHADELGKTFDALRTDRKSPDALMKLGGFYNSVGLHDLAAETYVKASKEAQGDLLVEAHAAAGASYVKAGNPEAALKPLKAGLSAAKDAPSPALLLALADAEAAQGHADKARSWYERLVKEHASTPQAATARGHLGTL